MKGNCKTKKPLLMDGIKKINGSNSKQVGGAKRLKVACLNTHLICVLCSGYYVEATAIVECLHTFCRSCIVKYLQSNHFCPICDVQIHQAKPWSSLRPDKTLQNLVYKLVPGLYQDEMRRRREFYIRPGRESEIGAKVKEEEAGLLPREARFFSQDDSISLSLEYYNECDGDEETDGGKAGKQLKEKPKRYLQCPAAVTVRHLKKFLRMKYGIGLDCWVDIIYNEECLPEDFSLIDVAYTFTWNRTSPMKFAYRIYSKTAERAIKSQKNFQIPRLDEGEKKKPKNQSSLEQQMQNEYLGNFNLNPTNSGICKTQNHNKQKSNNNNNNNNNNNSFVKNNNTLSEKRQKKEELNFKGKQELEDSSGWREKNFQSSEESNASGPLQIILEKEEESLREENSEDSSQESAMAIEEVFKKKKCGVSATNFDRVEEEEEEEEEMAALDSFCVKKVPRSSKHKSEGKKEKRKLEEAHGEKKRKSFEETKKKNGQTKRRKTIADEYSLKREMEEEILDSFSVRKEDDDLDSIQGNLKNEALRKVFVTKDKPEAMGKRKDGEMRRKKRKKSKHHEGELKRRKSETLNSSPSIMSFAKDPLKFKFKLTPNKSAVKISSEEEEEKEKEEDSEKKKCQEKDSAAGGTDKETKAKTEESEKVKKSMTDKERLLHLRAVRHKAAANKGGSPKDYINTPPSLTISKIDSSEQQPVKNTLVESKPSLEIMLVTPSDSSKGKKSESSLEARKEADLPKADSSKGKEFPRPAEVVDHFGVLDLSEKSTRTKESNSLNSSSPPSKEVPEAMERSRKGTHQSILQIAQTLVNRKLSPIHAETHMSKVGFDGSADSAAAMRNLKTLSDTAVNILMAAQSKNFSVAAAAAAAAELQKRSFPSASPPAHKSPKDCENGPGLKIPVYPAARERPNPMPPIPNLHEIYPRGRGGRPPPPLSGDKSSTPAIKPGQNQAVRQIPNPFVVVNRQANFAHNPVKSISPPRTENGEGGISQKKIGSIPPLQSIKTKLTLPKPVDSHRNGSSGDSAVESKGAIPKMANSSAKPVQNGSGKNHFVEAKTGGEEKKAAVAGPKVATNSSVRKVENMAKNIESVAAGLTARAVSNAMIDAK